MSVVAKIKVSKFRKQIFQPKLLPKKETNEFVFLSWLLIRIEKKFDGSVFGRSFGWKICFRILLTFRRCYYYNLGFNPTCFIISCHVGKHGCKLEVCNNTLHNGKIWWILSMLGSSHIVYKLYAWAKYVRHSFAFLLWQANLWVWLGFPNEHHFVHLWIIYVLNLHYSFIVGKCKKYSAW